MLGAVHIGAYATLGPMAVMQPGCFLADGASLGPLSLLRIGQTVSGSWRGAPAQCLAADTRGDSHVDLSSGMPSGLPCLVAVPISLYLSELPMAIGLAAWGISTGSVWWLDALKLIAMFWGEVVVAIVITIIAKWVLIGKVKPNMRIVSRWHCVRYWVVDRLMLGSAFRSAVMLLAGTPFIGAVFRTLGAKIGDNCMLHDLLVGADVDMVEFGDNVWVGSGVVLVGRSVTTAPSTPTSITPDSQPIAQCHHDASDGSDEKDAFLGNKVQDREQHVQMQCVPVGNHAMIAETVVVGGGEVADHQICGSTTLVDRVFRSREIVMGSPAGVMGLNHTVHEGMGAWVWAGTTAAAFMIPTLVILLLSLLMRLFKQYVVSHCFPFCSAHTSDVFFQTEVHELARTYIQTALLVTLSHMSVLLLFFTGNWLLITLFNLSSGQHKLYSAQMIIWDVAGQLQGVVFDTLGLFIRGTPLMRVYLRAVGATIGERVFWDAHPPVETRALTVKDDVVIEDRAVLFGHVVDHELLQFGPIHVGAGSVINAHSQVQPHTHIGSNVNVGVYTTVMKHEILRDGTSWVGSPMKEA